MPRLIFSINTTPIPKLRARVTGKHAYTPKKTLDWEAGVYWRAYAEMGMADLSPAEPELPVRVYMEFYLPVPKSYSKKRRAAMMGTDHTVRPDLDNLVKSMLDGMAGAVYARDTQVVFISVMKLWSETGRVKVEVGWEGE